MKRHLNNNGYALLLVLLFVMVMAVTMAGLSIKMTNNLKQSDQEQNSISAYYIAEGGAAEVMAQIENQANQLAKSETNINNFYTKLEQAIINNQSVTAFEPFNGEKPIAQVHISKVNNRIPRDYQIVSVGKIGNRERTVSGVFTMNFEEGTSGITFPPGQSIYSKTQIKLTGGASVVGDLIVNNASSKTVVVDGGANIQGKIKVPLGSKQPVLDAPSWWTNHPEVTVLREMPEYSLPEFPTFPNPQLAENKKEWNGNNSHEVIKNGNLYINNWIVQDYTYPLMRNTRFNEIILGSNSRVTFDIGNRDIAIVANNISGSGHIDIKGTGTLTIYLKGIIDISQGSFNSTNKARSFLYIAPSPRPSNPKEINLSSNLKMNASFYAADANFNLSGGASLYGLLVTGGNKITISGGVSATSNQGSNLIYAPNASVELTAGGNLYGSVIAKYFEASGGTKITSKEFNIEDNPIFSGGGSKKPGSLRIDPPTLKEVQN